MSLINDDFDRRYEETKRQIEEAHKKIDDDRRKTDAEWAEKTAKFDAEYAAVNARIDKQMKEIQEQVAADNQGQIMAAVERVFNDETSAADIAARNAAMQAIMNAPSITFAELEKMPTLQVKVFEVEWVEGKPNISAEDELNHEISAFMYENNLGHSNIAQFNATIDYSKIVPFGKSFGPVYLRAILTYWKSGKRPSDK